MYYYPVSYPGDSGLTKASGYTLLSNAPLSDREVASLSVEACKCLLFLQKWKVTWCSGVVLSGAAVSSRAFGGIHSVKSVSDVKAMLVMDRTDNIVCPVTPQGINTHIDNAGALYLAAPGVSVTADVSVSRVRRVTPSEKPEPAVTRDQRRRFGKGGVSRFWKTHARP